MFNISTAFMLVVGVLATQVAEARPSRPAELERLIAQALANNRQLAARSHEVRGKDEAITEARANYLPSVTLDARYTRIFNGLDLGELINPAYATLNQLTGSQAFPTDLRLVLPLALEAKLRIAQPVYVPALGPAHRLSKLGARAERVGQRIARREVVAAIGTAYYGHARVSLVAELLRQTRTLREENLVVSTALVAAGQATEDVVLRARAELAAHDQQLRDVDQQRRAIARQLNVLAALPPEAEVLQPSELAMPSVAADVAPLIARARSRRGEAALLDLSGQITSEQRALARSAFLPTLSVAVDLGFQRTSLGFEPDDAYAAISVVSSWNLFAGGSRY